MSLMKACVWSRGPVCVAPWSCQKGSVCLRNFLNSWLFGNGSLDLNFLFETGGLPHKLVELVGLGAHPRINSRKLPQLASVSIKMAVGQNQCILGGEFAPHFSRFCGWIGMFTGGTIWILTHAQMGLRIGLTKRYMFVGSGSPAPK